MIFEEHYFPLQSTCQVQICTQGTQTNPMQQLDQEFKTVQLKTTAVATDDIEARAELVHDHPYIKPTMSVSGITEPQPSSSGATSSSSETDTSTPMITELPAKIPCTMG